MRHRRATLLDFLTELLRFANNEMERQRRHMGGRCFPVCEPSPFNPTVCRNCGLPLVPVTAFRPVKGVPVGVGT